MTMTRKTEGTTTTKTPKKELTEFFYPNVGDGVTVKAESKEEADKLVAALQNKKSDLS